MINVWSYLDEYQIEKEEIHEAISSVLESGQLILGPHVKKFEEDFSEWFGSKYSVGVANGTDAIFLALKAFDIGVDDEVITVSNTAVPTVSAITATGAKPVFVDINPDTYLMDIEQVKSRITENTKAVIAVHLFGQAVDMDALNNVIKNYDIKIIEDCAQATGSMYKSKYAGNLGDISCFSFYPTKILGTYGDGGICMTNSNELNLKLRRLRFYGMEKNYYSLEQGYNSRLDEIHASILLKKLNHLHEYVKKRQQIASRYFSALKNSSYKLPTIAEYNVHSFYVFVIQHKRRDEVMKELYDRGINVNISYPWPIHSMKAMDGLTVKYDLPNTDYAAKHIFSLPMYPNLSIKQQDKVINSLIEIENKLK